MRLRLLLPLALLLLLGSSRALAHEIRPGLLTLVEVKPGWYEVTWKAPARGNMILKLSPELPECLELVGNPVDRMVGGALIRRYTCRLTQESLAGEVIAMSGLSSLQIDVLVRIRLLEGTHSVILRPTSPSFVIPEKPGSVELGWSYFLIGVRHILEGIDHLLFVLGLLLIVRSTSMLVKAITSFTVAHSITLAIATLGYANTPVPPLNAVIALSIFFLGPEIVRVWRGETSFTVRHPWVVAFAFGLLHGFGFASGLKTIGLPSDEIVISLLFFNIGVEAGQLFFVALILAMVRAFRVLQIQWPRWAQLTPGYAVGSLGAYWTIQRTVMLLA